MRSSSFVHLPSHRGHIHRRKPLFFVSASARYMGRPIVETSDSGNHVQFIRVSVLTQDEVSTIDVVVDETIRLRTGIRERLCSVTIAVHEAPIKPHLDVMLVTKCAKFLARLGSRHRPSSGTLPNELPSETVYQWNTPVPLDFGAVPQLPTFIRQRCPGVKRLFPHGCATWKRHLAGFLFLWHCSGGIYTYRLDTIQSGDA